MYPYQSPLGPIWLAADATALGGLWFEGQRHFPLQQGTVRKLPVFAAATRWLDAYFAGEKPTEEIPVHFTGTNFQCAVWQYLQTIPYGTTVTYGDIAKALGLSGGAQAVGGAVGRNPISVIVPCHRVIGADGSLTGYAGGLDRKMALLRLEKAI